MKVVSNRTPQQKASIASANGKAEMLRKVRDTMKCIISSTEVTDERKLQLIFALYVSK